jgi:hypothetical protein
MKATQFAATAALILALGACQPSTTAETPAVEAAASEAATTATGCVVAESRNWTAHVNAMPGPNAQRTLIVAGEVDLPSPGYSATLTEGPADRSAVPTQTLNLVVTPPPAGSAQAQVITPTAVTYSGRAIAQQYRGVRIACEGQQLAEMEVTIAH